MKVLVTGGSGFIGSTLIRKLNEKGIGVRALLRKPDHPNLKGLRFEAVQGDLLNPSTLVDAVRGVDGVIHVAGVVSAFQEKDYFEGNVQATENLVQALGQANPTISKFVLISSLAAGGPSKSASPRKETDPDSPVSLYGKSKKAAEQVVKKSTLPWVILRPPLVFGPKDRGCYLFFKASRYPFVPTFRNKEYSYIFSEDLCEGIVSAFVSPVKNETYYLASSQILPYSELILGFASGLGKIPKLISLPEILLIIAAHFCQKISEWTGKAFALNRDKINEIRPNRWTCDPSKARKDLGFISAHGLREGALITAKWYQQEGWL